MVGGNCRGSIAIQQLHGPSLFVKREPQIILKTDERKVVLKLEP